MRDIDKLQWQAKYDVRHGRSAVFNLHPYLSDRDIEKEIDKVYNREIDKLQRQPKNVVRYSRFAVFNLHPYLLDRDIEREIDRERE